MTDDADRADRPATLDRLFPDADERTVATGADTLLATVQEANADGYSAEFIARDDGTVLCTACRNAIEASDVRSERHWRLEGASDAADLMLVVASTCPTCGVGGTLVLGYGPNADDADVAVLPEIDLDPRDAASS